MNIKQQLQHDREIAQIALDDLSIFSEDTSEISLIAELQAEIESINFQLCVGG